MNKLYMDLDSPEKYEMMKNKFERREFVPVKVVGFDLNYIVSSIETYPNEKTLSHIAELIEVKDVSSIVGVVYDE